MNTKTQLMSMIKVTFEYYCNRRLETVQTQDAFYTRAQAERLADQNGWKIVKVVNV